MQDNKRRIPDFSVSSRVLSGRWMLPIMSTLTEPRRFGEIQTALPGMSRGVLAAQLQELCSFNLVQQTKHTCFPPCVEYELTPAGAELLEILSLLPGA